MSSYLRVVCAFCGTPEEVKIELPEKGWSLENHCIQCKKITALIFTLKGESGNEQ